MNKEFRHLLDSVLNNINTQILEVQHQAEKIGCLPSEIRTTTGDYMMTPLLLAKAQVLLAMSNVGFDLLSKTETSENVNPEIHTLFVVNVHHPTPVLDNKPFLVTVDKQKVTCTVCSQWLIATGL